MGCFHGTFDIQLCLRIWHPQTQWLMNMSQLKMAILGYTPFLDTSK